MSLPPGAPISDRFKDVAVNQEPVMSVGVIVAVLLTFLDQYFHFTDGQAAMLVYFAPIAIAWITRNFVWSPASHQAAVDAAVAKAYDLAGGVLKPARVIIPIAAADPTEPTAAETPPTT